MLEGLNEFLADPLVAPMILLLILVIVNFVLKVYASLRPGWPGSFSWDKLPQFLRTAVLDKVVPLMVLGAAAFMLPDIPIAGIDVDVSFLVTTMYLGGVAAAILAEIASLREAFPQNA